LLRATITGSFGGAKGSLSIITSDNAGESSAHVTDTGPGACSGVFQNMNLLAIETATETVSVALSMNDELMERYQHAPRQHAELLLP